MKEILICLGCLCPQDDGEDNDVCENCLEDKLRACLLITQEDVKEGRVLLNVKEHEKWK